MPHYMVYFRKASMCYLVECVFFGVWIEETANRNTQDISYIHLLNGVNSDVSVYCADDSSFGSYSIPIK